MEVLNILFWAICLGTFAAIVLIATAFNNDAAKNAKAQLAAGEVQLALRGRILEQKYDEQMAELEKRNTTARENEARRADETLALAIAEIRQESEKRFRSEFLVTDLVTLNDRIKEGHGARVYLGRVLTVRVLSSPTGWVVMEWTLDPRLAQPLKVICWRDAEMRFAQFAHRGVHYENLERGKAYGFNFAAIDGKIDREGSLQFVFRMPTQEEWSRSITPPPEADEKTRRKAKVIAEIERATSELEVWEEALRKTDPTATDGPEDMKRKATIRASIVRARDAAERS